MGRWIWKGWCFQRQKLSSCAPSSAIWYQVPVFFSLIDAAFLTSQIRRGKFSPTTLGFISSNGDAQTTSCVSKIREASQSKPKHTERRIRWMLRNNLPSDVWISETAPPTQTARACFFLLPPPSATEFWPTKKISISQSYSLRKLLLTASYLPSTASSNPSTSLTKQWDSLTNTKKPTNVLMKKSWALRILLRFIRNSQSIFSFTSAWLGIILMARERI